MRTAVDSGVDVDVRDLRESLMQAEGISVRGVGGCILLGRRNINLPEDQTWSEEPCSSFRDEVERRMGKNRRSKDKRCKHGKMQVNKRMRK